MMGIQRYIVLVGGLMSLMNLATASPNFSLINNILRGEKPQNVSASPIPGVYEFNIGADIFYLSEDGRYLIQGEIIDLTSRKNLTESKRSDARLALLKSMNPKDMIIFSPSTKPKHIVYVFTDVDCGYCRMLHKNINGYNDEGIEIRYLSFPRAGIGSESYKKAVNVWCADDRKEAMTMAKEGLTVKSKPCDAPVRKQYQAGLSIGVSGTPALILEDGTLVPGFVRPAKLAAMLDAHKSK